MKNEVMLRDLGQCDLYRSHHRRPLLARNTGRRAMYVLTVRYRQIRYIHTQATMLVAEMTIELARL
jgi:hypothetical protein